ncbi:hypothetical protein C0J52_15428 [Blattella germanica]|nr:hypothetical protein C0J52_15428 [Blattella germanica]
MSTMFLYRIGFATAERLAAEGACVMVSSRKKENVANAIEKLKERGFSGIAGTVCHVAKSDEREKLFRETQAAFGGIDILIANAAVNPAFGPLFENLGPYGVSKTALLGLTKAASIETAKDNIRVNCVVPGGIKTRFSEVVSKKIISNSIIIISEERMLFTKTKCEVESVINELLENGEHFENDIDFSSSEDENNIEVQDEVRDGNGSR